jgi:hypothetical protein
MDIGFGYLVLIVVTCYALTKRDKEVARALLPAAGDEVWCVLQRDTSERQFLATVSHLHKNTRGVLWGLTVVDFAGCEVYISVAEVSHVFGKEHVHDARRGWFNDAT